MFEKLNEAWAVRSRQFSTKIGVLLTTASAVASQIAPYLTTINDKWGGYATKTAAVVGILLVLWNEDKSNGPPPAAA
jgi:bacteriorhodopsin